MSADKWVARVWHNGYSWQWCVDPADAPLPGLFSDTAFTERGAIRAARREKARRIRIDARRTEERIV